MAFVIQKGSTDVTRYVQILDASTGADETGATITNFDLQYTRTRALPSSLANVTALSAADDAHADNQMIEIDATSSPGLYRVDWPNAAFATGVSSVQLVVTSSDSFASSVEEIQLVNYDPENGVDLGLTAIAIASSYQGFHGTGIFLDSGAGNTNTVLGTDGTENNPVSTIAAAQTLVTSLAINRIYIMNNSAITLDANSNEYEFIGEGAAPGNSINLNSKTVDFSTFRDITVTGVQGGGASAELITLTQCEIDTLTNLHCHADNCLIAGDFTMTAHEDHVFAHCYSGATGSAVPAITFAAGTSDVHFAMYSGSLELKNMSATSELIYDCPCGNLVFNASCSGGIVLSRGVHDFTDNAGGAITHTITARVTNLTTNTECDTALVDINLDHLMKTATASSTDLTTEVADNTVLSYIMTNDGNTSDYVDGTMSLEAISGGGGGAPSAAVVADAVWDELMSAHVISGSGGFELNALASQFTRSSPNRLVDHFRAMSSKGATEPSSGFGTYSAATDSLEAQAETLAGMEGSGFNTGTDSLEAIRNAIDTLLAPSVVSSSALSGSGFLSDCVSAVRRATDEPSVTPKYTDSILVEMLQVAMETVLTDIHLNTDHPWMIRHDITLVSGTQDYILPPGVGELLRIAKVNSTTGLAEWEAWPGSYFSPGQEGWKLEGNKLRLLRDWLSTDTIQILYRPSGDGLMHKGNVAEDVAASTITFMATPTDGTLDKRPNGLVGMMVRLLGSTEGVIEERLITAYNVTTRVASIDVAWDTTPTGTVIYEVVPLFSRLIKDVVCLRTAIDVLSQEGNQKRMQTLMQNYMVKVTAMRRSIESKEARFPHHFDGEGWDNSNRGWGA